MDVSIIIVTYNTCQMTGECIDSIIEHTRDVEYEIILVDNASRDGSKQTFSNDSRLTYIYNEENIGFGRANNIGAREAKGDYLFLLNSDTLLTNNAIKHFMDYMASAPTQTGCCGCLLTNRDGEPIHSFGKRHTYANSMDEWILFPWMKKLHLRHSLKKYDEERPRTVGIEVREQIDYITGADLFIRRSVYEACGLFDPDFFMYYEDAHLCRKYQKAGYRCAVITTPGIIHLVGASNREITPPKKLMILQSMLLYHQKDHSALSFALFKRLFKLTYLTLYALSALFKPKKLRAETEYIKNVAKL